MSRSCTRAALAMLVLIGSFVLAAPLPPTADLQGDPLPAGARARLGSGRLRHGYTVSALAFSPDGKTLASTSHEHTARFWDVATGKQLRAIGEDQARVNVYDGSRWLTGVAYSVDGKTVATVSQDYTVRLFDAATAKEQRRVTVPNGAVRFSLSPDGSTLAVVNRVGMVEVLDLAGAKNRLLGGVVKPNARIMRNTLTAQVVFAPGGKILAASTGDGVVRLWDVATRAEAHQLTGLGTTVTSLAWSPDGKRLAALGGQGQVVVWDAGTRKELARRDWGRTGEYPWIAFLPDNTTLISAGGGDPKVRLWDTAKKTTRELDGPGAVTSAALSPDGKTLALGSYFSSISLLDLTTGKLRDLAPGHTGHLHHIAFSRDGKRLTTGSSDCTIRLWDAQTSRELKANLTAGPSLALSADGRLAVTKDTEQPVRLWNAESGRTSYGTTGFTKDTEKPVRLWDASEGKLAGVLKGSEGTRMPAALSPDGKLAATMSADGLIRLWDTATAKLLKEMKGHQGEVTAMAFAAGGELLASSGEDGTVRLWEVGTGAELRRMEGFSADAFNPNDPRFRYSRLAFSPDGRTLARGGTDGLVVVWEVASGKTVRTFRGHIGYVLSLAFSPDGRSLAVGSWMNTRLWDLPSGGGRGEALGHKGDVMALAFSPDGTTLASGGSDTVGYLWDMATAFKPAPARAAKLTEKELESRWEELANASAEKAYQAMWDLASAQAVPMLAKRLKPVKPTSDKEIAKLIADLEDDDFDTRTKASAELTKLGKLAEPALRKALAGAMDVDLKLRLNVLVGNLDSAPAGEALRVVRAVQALEAAKSAEARKLLQSLAEGAPLARQTREAKSALDRLR